MSPVSWYCLGLECTQPCGVSWYGVNRCRANRYGMKRHGLGECFYPELPAVALCRTSLNLLSCYGVTLYSMKLILYRTKAWKATSTLVHSTKPHQNSPVYPPCSLALVSSSTLNSSNQLSWQQQTGQTSVTGWRNRSSNTQNADEIRLFISSNDENRKR